MCEFTKRIVQALNRSSVSSQYEKPRQPTLRVRTIRWLSFKKKPIPQSIPMSVQANKIL